MPRLHSGALDRRIVIKQLAWGKSAFGEDVQTPSTLATVWANVRQKSGREFFGGDIDNAEVDTLFRIRHRTDLNNTMHIVYGGNTYNIYSIREIGRKAGLEILAKAEVS